MCAVPQAWQLLPTRFATHVSHTSVFPTCTRDHGSPSSTTLSHKSHLSKNGYGIPLVRGVVPRHRLARRAPHAARPHRSAGASLPRGARCGIGWRHRDGEGSVRVVPSASHRKREVCVCCEVARVRARMSIQGDSPCRRRRIKRVWFATQGLVVRAADVVVTETMGPKSRVTLNVPTHSPEAASPRLAERCRSLSHPRTGKPVPYGFECVANDWT